MTDPIQPTPTQVLHPWRSTVRTAVAALVALLPVLPLLIESGHLGALPWVAPVVAAAAAVTRILAMPAVDQWLRQYAPWLAAQPADGAS